MMSEFKDERFAHIATDSRFRQLQKSQRKVKIDKRFKQMFTDKQFKLKYTIDKRGRPTDTSTSENLKKYYDISDSDSDDSSGDQQRLSSDEEDTKKHHGKNFKKKGKAASKAIDNIEQEPEPGTSKQTMKLKKNCSDVDSSESEDEDDGPDLARGVGNIESSSEEEEDDDSGVEAEEAGDSLDHQWGELDKNVPVAEDLGKRLAICNMDWDRIKAVDIFVLINSFVPPGGVLHSVKIYPSEYGLQRMEEEKIKGPQELVETPGITITTNDEDDDNLVEDKEGSRYHREKLRQYQLNRLKYYYAVAECDSIQTASQIYEECDGTEYESSAAKVDLRFIPDDMTFDQEPKSVCTEAPDKKSYKPTIFVSSAISQSKVNLTWDETDQDRVKLTMRNPYKKVKEEVNEDDFKAYLASSSDEEDPYGNIAAVDNDDNDASVASSDEEGQINKYKMLLQNIQEVEKKKEDRDVEMEVTWEPGLKETTEKLIKKKEESKDLTPWEEYLQKKKEKRKKKKEGKRNKPEKGDTVEVRGKKEKTEEGSDRAFSDDEVADVDMSDPFFTEELEDGEKKAVKKNKKKKKEKQKEVLTEEEMKEKEKREAELELLMEDDEDENRKHFSLKKLVEDNKSKKKKKKNKLKKNDEEQLEGDFKIDTSDKRFEAMFSSALYNIDPTAPEYKKTKGMEALVEEKLKRRKAKESQKRKHEPEETIVKAKKTVDVVKNTEESLASLVQSIKTKTSKFHSKTKR